ncbi:hypothetical protein HRI_000057300 [Hibiscus trionum]|uniref:Oligosaccharyl transferase subunit DAD1 n=1 Tax=Hibiscus trionum TaxID=183268 RepID=A0A9W7GTW2_HIBTR|nr:hypothetical protein HRI_000057300 [Hibiscus trionum]
MGRASSKEDARALFHSLRSAYAATPVNLKIIDLYVGFAIFTALIQSLLVSRLFIIPLCEVNDRIRH